MKVFPPSNWTGVPNHPLQGESVTRHRKTPRSVHSPTNTNAPLQGLESSFNGTELRSPLVSVMESAPDTHGASSLQPVDTWRKWLSIGSEIESSHSNGRVEIARASKTGLESLEAGTGQHEMKEAGSRDSSTDTERRIRKAEGNLNAAKNHTEGKDSEFPGGRETGSAGWPFCPPTT